MVSKVTAILQARMGSSRLPGKVSADLAGRTLLEFLIERVRRSKSVDHIILATTDLPADNCLVELANKINLTIFRGSKDDVLDRYAKASMLTDAEVIVRLTGDCPLLDPQLIDQL